MNVMVRITFLIACLLVAALATGQDAMAVSPDWGDAVYQQDSASDDVPCPDDSDGSLPAALDIAAQAIPQTHPGAPVCAGTARPSDRHLIRAPPLSDYRM